MNTLVKQRFQHAVLIPVSVVLVPRPGAADLGVFHHHFGVVMVDFTAEQFLRGLYHPFAAGEHAVNSVAGMVPQRQPHRAAFAVGAAEGAAVEFVVLLGGATEQVDLLRVEKARD